mgnify:CR=1 FL=1
MTICDGKVLLNVDEAALILRIAAATLYNWVHKRKIPFRKHGRKVLFLKGDLESWSKKQEVGVEIAKEPKNSLLKVGKKKLSLS